MRLLFGREFPFDDVLIMWDVLFANGLRSDLVDFTCIAMLLRIRWEREYLE
jgi:TBC1 domain family protein 5